MYLFYYFIFPMHNTQNEEYESYQLQTCWVGLYKHNEEKLETLWMNDKWDLGRLLQ